MTNIRNTDQAQLFVWSDVDPDHETGFNQWYDREHMEERVRIPGFTGARRYLALYRASIPLHDGYIAEPSKCFACTTVIHCPQHRAASWACG